MGYVVIPASSFCDSYLQVSIVNKLADVQIFRKKVQNSENLKVEIYVLFFWIDFWQLNHVFIFDIVNLNLKVERLLDLVDYIVLVKLNLDALDVHHQSPLNQILFEQSRSSVRRQILRDFSLKIFNRNICNQGKFLLQVNQLVLRNNRHEANVTDSTGPR